MLVFQSMAAGFAGGLFLQKLCKGDVDLIKKGNNSALFLERIGYIAVYATGT